MIEYLCWGFVRPEKVFIAPYLRILGFFMHVIPNVYRKHRLFDMKASIDASRSRAGY